MSSVRDSTRHLAAHFSAPAQRERAHILHSRIVERFPSVLVAIITPTTLFIR